MANPVPNNRELVIDEEVKRNAGVSEQLGTKLGGIANFIMTDQLIRDDFKANGSYRLGVGTVGLDGILIFPTKVEIVMIGVSSQRVGLSGITEFDIHWLDAPGSDMGTIFTVTPTFDSTSTNNSYTLTDVINAVDTVTAVGAVNPRVNKTQFLQGEAIRCDLVSGMEAGQDAQINVFYRPIT